MVHKLPLLIVVQGGSATGKSTLAKRLSSDHGIHLISKDIFKELLYNKLGIPASNKESELYGKAAIAAMYATAESFLRDGHSVIVESAFNKIYAEQDIKAIVDRTNVELVQIYCTASVAVRTSRELQRHASGERHSGHYILDLTTPEQIARDTATYISLSIESTLHVDTDDGYDPAYGAINDFVKRHLKHK